MGQQGVGVRDVLGRDGQGARQRSPLFALTVELDQQLADLGVAGALVERGLQGARGVGLGPGGDFRPGQPQHHGDQRLGVGELDAPTQHVGRFGGLLLLQVQPCELIERVGGRGELHHVAQCGDGTRGVAERLLHQPREVSPQLGRALGLVETFEGLGLGLENAGQRFGLAASHQHLGERRNGVGVPGVLGEVFLEASFTPALGFDLPDQAR